MRYQYTPKGVCSTQINIDVDENDVIKSIEFVGNYITFKRCTL